MSEVIRFVSKSERERIQLIRETRAIYESVFPSTDGVNEQRHSASTNRAVGDDNVRNGDDVRP
jgi:hypothetical protein